MATVEYFPQYANSELVVESEDGERGEPIQPGETFEVDDDQLDAYLANPDIRRPGEPSGEPSATEQSVTRGDSGGATAKPSTTHAKPIGGTAADTGDTTDASGNR